MMHTLFPYDKDEHDKDEPTVLLDIDGTLAIGYEYPDKEKLVKAKPHLAEFDDTLFIHAIWPHVLFPGAPELIKWIVDKNLALSFFSSGSESRNIPFVDSLLQLALKEDSLNAKVSIYSMQHLDVGHKKNLELVLDTTRLNNKILVDDNPGVIMSEQERNVLITPSLDEDTFGLFVDDDTAIVKYFCGMNHIFYVAGVLNCIMNIETKTLANALYSLQYPTGWERDENMMFSPQYYLEGLNVLRQINPELEFYGGQEVYNYFVDKQNLSLTRNDEEAVCKITIGCTIL